MTHYQQRRGSRISSTCQLGVVVLRSGVRQRQSRHHVQQGRL